MFLSNCCEHTAFEKIMTLTKHTAFRSTRSILSLALMLWGPSVHSQQPQPPAIRISAEKGEVCVQGVIQSVDVKRGSFVLAVSAVYPPGKGRVAFAVPRPKTVLIGAQTTVQEPDKPGEPPIISGLTGLGAIVSGQDTGIGNPLPARQIILWSPQTNAHVEAGGKDTGGTLPRYSITDIGTLPGDIESVATGLNERGDVVGQSVATYSSDGQEVGQGFVWKAGQIYGLGVTRGYQDSVAFRISNAGQIVGAVNNHGHPVTLRTLPRGCWWQSGTIHVLHLGPLAVWNLAIGINVHGAIVGTLSLPL